MQGNGQISTRTDNSTDLTHHLVNTSKEAEMSISPTLIIPVLANNGRYFKVKTLLDSGSGTNWIVRKVLNQIKHTVKGKNNLLVYTFNGTVKRKFTLVEIYFHDDRGRIRNIMCYVQDEYTTHVSVDVVTISTLIIPPSTH